MTSAPDASLPPGQPAAAVIDAAAISANVRVLAAAAGGSGAGVLAVVKADGYGHGLLPAARAALAGGASWLGTAQLGEALQLRAAGIDAPVLAWLTVPGDQYQAAIAAGIDLGVSAEWALTEIAAAAERAGRPARIHLKVDTGLNRNGLSPVDLPGVLAQALRHQAAGTVRLVGVFSHLAWADAPTHPTVLAQVEAFTEVVGILERAGAELEVRHLANSAAALTNPKTHFDLVRPGLAVYGLSPVPELATADQLGLRPAMSLVARLATVKPAPAGGGVSYGHTYTCPTDTLLGVVPLGYADGVPRHAGNRGPVQLAGRRLRVAGRVCMDQFVLDLGPDAVDQAGDPVLLFGPGDRGEPTAQDWAEAAGTISYEIVSRLGTRVPRLVLADPGAA